MFSRFRSEPTVCRDLSKRDQDIDSKSTWRGLSDEPRVKYCFVALFEALVLATKSVRDTGKPIYYQRVGSYHVWASF